jgi:DNA-binding beta-propeller fold protein YncE
MKMFITRIATCFALLCCLGLLQVVLATPLAHADGGAPNLAYVSGTTAGVSVIGVVQAKVAHTFPLPGDPHMILLSLSGDALYVTQPELGRLTVMATRTGQVRCTIRLPGQPALLAFDQNTGMLYAAGNGADVVTALDPQTCAVQHTFRTGSPIYGLAVTIFVVDNSAATFTQLWAAGSNAITVFDDRSGKFLTTIPIAGGPQYLSIPPGPTVYVTTRQGTVDAVDLKTRQVRQLLSGGTFGPMDYDALTGEVYVPDEQHNVIDILAPIDPSTEATPREPERTFHTDLPPVSVAITNDGLLGFVALRGGKIMMLDLIGRQVAYTVDVGGTPHFVITGPFPPASNTSTVSTAASPQDTTRSIIIDVIIGTIVISLSVLVVSLVMQSRLARQGRK